MLLAVALMASALVGHGPLKGDFDHDGKADIARFVRRADGRYALQVERGAAPGRPVVVEVFEKGEGLQNLFLDTALPGRFQTACGKGYYGPETGRCTRDWVRVRRGDLTFGYRESSDAVAVWAGRRFQVEWLSD